MPVASMKEYSRSGRSQWVDKKAATTVGRYPRYLQSDNPSNPQRGYSLAFTQEAPLCGMLTYYNDSHNRHVNHVGLAIHNHTDHPLALPKEAPICRYFDPQYIDRVRAGSMIYRDTKLIHSLAAYRG